VAVVEAVVEVEGVEEAHMMVEVEEVEELVGRVEWQ
jgi:hypothetical protein